jgi:hypothetical protein
VVWYQALRASPSRVQVACGSFQGARGVHANWGAGEALFWLPSP